MTQDVLSNDMFAAPDLIDEDVSVEGIEDAGTDTFETAGFSESLWNSVDPFSVSDDFEITDSDCAELVEKTQVHDPAEAFLKGLNPEQAEAVLATEGPVVIIAGAGTGKTKTATNRTAYIIGMGLAKPEEVLSVTFTNKAANEMKERITLQIGEQAHKIRMGSFHSICMRILKHHPRAAGLKSESFSVLDTDDQLKLLEAVALERGISPDDVQETKTKKTKMSKEWKDRMKKALSIISGWKERGLTSDLFERGSSPVMLKTQEQHDAASMYPLYQEALLVRNACDFADLILHVVMLFRKDEKIRQHWANQFKYVQADEYQDTNDLQEEFLTQLCKDHRNLFVVGDTDQSIYEFRGARPQIMLNFENKWPGAKMIVLHRNYRSTQQILDVSNAIVNDMERLVEKNLNSNVEGSPVELYTYDTHIAEAEAIGREISGLIANGHDPDEIAILVRSSFTMRGYEEQLIRHGVPYTVVGGMKFNEREEVKDALAYLRLANEPNDEFAFLRVCNKPRRNIGENTAQQIVQALRSGKAGTLKDACLYIRDNAKRLRSTTKDGLTELAQYLTDFPIIAKNFTRPGDVLAEIFRVIGYWKWRAAEEDEKINEREESIIELCNDANQYTDVGTYLQVAMTLAASDNDRDTKVVRISTIHASKGLEFETVFTPCLEEGSLPNARALEAPNGLDEEKRIAHVAWTRAKKRLVISFAHSRFYKSTMPSEFLYSAGLLDKEGNPIEQINQYREARVKAPAPEKVTYRRASIF